MCLAIPGKIISIRGLTAKVSFGGAVSEAHLLFCPEARVGDYGLVHAGTVLEIIDEKRAEEVLENLREIS